MRIRPGIIKASRSTVNALVNAYYFYYISR